MFKVLIISPYFPPVNAADMHRVRTSLRYYSNFQWHAELVVVDSRFADMGEDQLLNDSIPSGIKIHKVKAFEKNLTRKIGLGSIGIRSLLFYRNKVNELLKTNSYDLIYFSTTQFPVCVLGPYWKKKFRIPFVVDIQDPWHSDYYMDKPKEERPPKYWFSYRLNKWLEPIALRNADGLISVSKFYIKTLQTRYPILKTKPSATITFGAFPLDLQIAKENADKFEPLLDAAYTNLVYIGRGGADMQRSLHLFFKAISNLLLKNTESVNRIKIHFIGTSYAPSGMGIPTVLPLAKSFGLENYVVEKTDRIGYYQALNLMQEADALILFGSDDPTYTASKIYPYLLSNKPLLSLFNSNSSVIEVMEAFGAEYNLTYDNTPLVINRILDFMDKLISGTLERPSYNRAAELNFSAKKLTSEQCKIFNSVLDQKYQKFS